MKECYDVHLHFVHIALLVSGPLFSVLPHRMPSTGSHGFTSQETRNEYPASPIETLIQRANTSLLSVPMVSWDLVKRSGWHFTLRK